MSPQEYQDHQTAVEAQDESHNINTGKMFSSFDKPSQKIRRTLGMVREDASCFLPVSLSRPRSALSRFMVILAII